MAQPLSQLVSHHRHLSNQSVITWWAPLWRGLAVEASGKHYKAMGKAVWLYIYLIVHANRRTGTLFRLIPTIAREMGIPERTVRLWLMILRRCGYVTTQQAGRGLEITINKWKPLKMRKAGKSITHKPETNLSN